VVPVHERRCSRHGSLKGNRCDSIRDKMMKGSLEVRNETKADIGTERRNNCDAMGTFFVCGHNVCVFRNDKSSAHSSNREMLCHTLKENCTELGLLFMDHQHCLFIR